MNWVSIKKRLPEPNPDGSAVYILAYCDGRMFVGNFFFLADGTPAVHDDAYFGETNTRFTHWMPLPPAPEKE